MITCEMISANNFNNSLGNQMFCISATIALALRNNDEAVFALTKAVDKYKNNILRNIKFGNIKSQKHFYEKDFSYNKLDYSKNLHLHGFFQSEKYFLDYKDYIIEIFSIDEENKKYIYNKYGNIFDKSVSIHVRRSDYLLLPDYHPVCKEEYYKIAIKEFSDNFNIIVFSDDIEWCKVFFKDYRCTYIHEDDYIDLWCMSMCDHNIIANSSFSWWSAWLNKNPDKIVIAPKKWFGSNCEHSDKDIIPERWIKI